MQNRYTPKPIKIASNIRLDKKTPDQIKKEMQGLKKPIQNNPTINKTQVVKNKIENMNRLKRGL